VADTNPELVRRSRDGDQDAFATLYQAHVGRVYALCLRMTADPQAATEATQDVFVQAWKSLATFREEAAFSTWLHRLAFNTVRQRQRGEGRRRGFVSLEEDGVEESRELVRSGQEDARMDLERAIALLPPRARNALVLHDIQGYRCREVAELTGSAVGTIQAHLHRARKMLREILER
jgi:RNA polymerase sigma-70 factor, ECF subfamily